MGLNKYNYSKMQKCIPIGLFILYFILLSAFRHNTVFCDENDNFMGGVCVVSGNDVYSGFISQHTPLMYYIAAFFRLLGAASVLQFRVCFYALLALIWVGMYLRYSNYFGKLTMAIYPVGYIMIMIAVNTFLSTSILSEQFQSQGMIILLMEFLMFCETKEIKIKNMIAISFAIIISFGTAFVSVFAIFIVTVGVLFVEIRNQLVKTKNILIITKNLFIKYWKLICIISLPFVVLFIWYLISGNLRNAYKGVFVLNTEIYSKYNNGYGSSIIGIMFGTINSYFGNIAIQFSSLLSDPMASLRSLLFTFINFLYIIKLFKKDWSAALFTTVLIFMCGSRGYTGFHSLPYWAVTLFMGASLLNEYVRKHTEQKLEISLGRSVVFSLVLVLLITPYFSQFSAIKPTKTDFVTENSEGTYAYYIDKVTNKDDKIQVFSLETEIYLNADRLPATIDIAAGVCPWIYEMYGTEILAKLKADTPKVVIFHEDYDVWGYYYKDFAPEVISYVKANYTRFEESGMQYLYVRNDYYNTAVKLLNESY